MKQLIISLFLVCGFQSASASQFFPYNDLLLKDLEQMSSLVRDKIRLHEQSLGESSDDSSQLDDGVLDADSSSESAENLTPLKEALQAVYSRPNLDDMIQKVIGPLRSELEASKGWEKTVSALVDEALVNLKKPKRVQARVQATYVIMLNNMVNEFKAYADEPGFEQQILKKIEKADIELTKEAISEISLRVLKAAVSPSESAEFALEAIEKKQKEKNKKKKD